MRRLISLILILLLLLSAAGHAYQDIPDCLRITQTGRKTTLSSTAYQQSYYPDTCFADIDAALSERIDQLAALCTSYIPAKPGNPQEKSYVDAGASVFRTGSSWASFLLTACAVDNRTQLHVAMDARAYDMETGRTLQLCDVVTDDAKAFIESEVRSQLSAYFPQLPTDETALNHLLSALDQTPFTLNTSFLTLHYQADALYPGHPTLMHVRIPYSALSDYLTPEAQKQTDNSNYRLVALTYDDGPARMHTLKIARALRAGAANATFFIVGDRRSFGPELIAYEHDTGFSVGSHNYSHVTEREARGNVHFYKDTMAAMLTELIGCAPTIMRAPGGGEYVYLLEEVGLPMFNWSLVANEALDRYVDPYREARRLAKLAQDGDIILMHDLRANTAEIAQYLPAAFAEKHFLCVTVEELFAARGLPLEPNTVYYNAHPAQ